MYNGTVPAAVSMDNVHVIGVVGIIGVSKSTAIDMLQHSGALSKKALAKRGACVCFFQEPSREWRSKGYLQAFYENPAENAAAFQIIVFASAVRAFEALIAETRKKHPLPTPIVVVADRTHMDQLLFWTIQNDRGHVNWLMNEAYMGVWELWRRFVPTPRRILFFQTSSVHECMRRLAERANAPRNDGTEVTEVNGVTLEYQTQLFAKHCEWYTTPLSSEGIPCTHVNVDADFRHDAVAFSQLETRVWEQIKQMLPK